MRYDDGSVSIYTVTNASANGAMPTETLTLSATYYYHQDTVGVTRYYQALQADQQIAKVLSIPDWPDIKTGDVAKMDSESTQFRISFIQQAYDEHGLKQTKLTLEVISNEYAIN